MEKETSSCLPQSPHSGWSEKDKAVSQSEPHSGGGQPEVVCREVVLRLEAMCPHGAAEKEPDLPELVSGEENLFHTSTPDDMQEEASQNVALNFNETISLSPVTDSTSVPTVYQIPLKERTLRDVTCSLLYPPPPPPSPGASVVKTLSPERQSPKQLTFVKAVPAQMELSPKHKESDSEVPSTGEEPVLRSAADHAPPTSVQAPPTTSVHADIAPPTYPQTAVQPSTSQYPQLQPAAVQSQPVAVTQNVGSSNQQTQAAPGIGMGPGMDGYYGGGMGWGWNNETGTRNAKYLVLALVMLLLSLCNPVLFLCAVPACIGAVVALVEGHSYEDMMMGGVHMREENDPARALNVFSLVCSVIGMTLCGLMSITSIIVVILLVSLGYFTQELIY